MGLGSGAVTTVIDGVSPTQGMEFHPVANLFPLMDADDFEALIEDIRANGLHDDIVLHEGKIVDGRHRYRACLKAKREPRFQDWDGQGSLVAYVVSKNRHRRHLTKAQNAAVAVDMLPHLEAEGLKRKAEGGMRALETRGVIERREAEPAMGGEGGDVEEEGVGNGAMPDVPKMAHLGKSQDQAAAMLGVSHGYVSDARKVKEEVPEAFEALRAGTVTMPQAKAIVAAPADERPALIEQAVRRHTTPRGKRGNSDEPLTPLNRVRPKLTIDQRERYQATVYRVLRVAPWRAVEVLLEFGVLEKMTVATLLRLCRETRHDKGLDTQEEKRDGRG